jgi:hypothetical protein
MKKRVAGIIAWAILALFSFGCGQEAINNSNLKCPKCGAVFTIDEGIQQYQRSI